MIPVEPDTTVTAIWTMCPTCWGQRNIFENLNGEGLVPVACPTCLGLGDLLAA